MVIGFPLLWFAGLSLILRAEQKDHIPLLSTVAGVKVMIHNHNQTPFLEHEGFDIRPGIATTIGIQQVSRQLRSVVAFPSNCRKP